MHAVVASWGDVRVGPVKAEENAKKHRVRFEEAASVFLRSRGTLTFEIPITLRRKIAKSPSAVPCGDACPLRGAHRTRERVGNTPGAEAV